MKPNVAAIIPAAGSGTRMKSGQPKQFLEIGGAPLLVHTVRTFLAHPAVTTIVVAVPADWCQATCKMFTHHGLTDSSIIVTAGGKRRQDSVMAGLMQLDDATDIVLVHDGARPLLSPALIDRCWQAAETHGCAIAAVPVKDTLKRGDSAQRITATVNRENLWQAQTPQAARRALLLAAFEVAGNMDVTDEAMLLEHAGHQVILVEGEETNLKITRPEDLALAETIMQQSSPPQFRIGHGYDVHRLTTDRKLVLGGVTIPYEYGLAGHSDADVVTHALCDALLGALGCGDIGHHFPDSDAAFKDVYSITLLKQVTAQMVQQGYRIGNIDLTIICQRPKLAPHLDEMQTLLAAACQTSNEHLNIKATTTEKLGFAGRGEGISCHAVALLYKHA